MALTYDELTRVDTLSELLAMLLSGKFPDSSSIPARAVSPPKGSKTFLAVAPAGSAVLLLAANANRISAAFVNNGSVTVYIGKANTVTVGNGFPLFPGQPIYDDDSTDAWYGITAGTAGDIRGIEVA
jgi:hypothetical protein